MRRGRYSGTPPRRFTSYSTEQCPNTQERGKVFFF